MEAIELKPQPIEGYSDTKTVAYDNPFMKVVLIPSPYGLYNSIETGATNKGVVVLITTATGVVFVKQNRYPSGYACWELPRGGVDEGETFIEAAMREVEEETGLQILEELLTPLGRILPDSGVFSTHIEVFSVHLPNITVLTKEKNEEIDSIALVPRDILQEAINEGYLWDCLTLSALMLHQSKTTV